MAVGPNLPTNLDATYPDTSDPTAKIHQAMHDSENGVVNRFAIDLTPADGDHLVWSAASSLWVPEAPPPLKQTFSTGGDAVIGASGPDRADVARTITSARMRTRTAPAGSDLIVQVQHFNGTSWSTITTLTMTAGSLTEVVSGTLTQAQSVGHLLRVNATSVGSTTAAQGVVVDVFYSV